MFLSTGRAWAESVRGRWQDDPWSLRIATGAVTVSAYAALAGSCILAWLGGGSAAALLGAAALLVLGSIALTTSVFLRLPPWLAWRHERPSSPPDSE